MKGAPQLPVQDAEKEEESFRIYDINIIHTNVVIIEQAEKQEEKIQSCKTDDRIIKSLALQFFLSFNSSDWSHIFRS